MMQFCLLDRIIELEPGQHIKAVRLLRAEEDYLADHFPLFPVMPGVLMLEAMYQASAWLVRKTENFAHAAVLLKEARNVKYSDFVSPGHELVVTAQMLKQDASTTTLKAEGTVDGRVAVSARLVLERFHLGDRNPHRKTVDPYCIHEMKLEFLKLTTPA